MADQDTDTETTNDVIGRRLTGVGIVSALLVGVIWLAQWNTHRESEADFGALTGDTSFSSTPYAIAFGIAVAVVVFGLVLRGSARR